MAAKLLAKDKNAAIAFLTNYTNMTAQSTFDTWKQLGTFLIVKYNDGVVKRMKDGQFERNSIGQPVGVIRPGYPKEFLEEYVKQTGDRYLVKWWMKNEELAGAVYLKNINSSFFILNSSLNN